MILPDPGTLNAGTGEAPMDREVRDFKVQRQLAALRDQAEREIAGARAARYATHREIAGAYQTQPLRAVGGGQRTGGPRYELSGHTVTLAPPVPPMPSPEVSAARVCAIAYPDPAALAAGTVRPLAYARTLRHIGPATGTSSRYEADGAWRLAIETGSEAAR